MKHPHKLAVSLLAAMMSLSGAGISAFSNESAVVVSSKDEMKPAASNNIHGHDYSVWAKPANSSLVKTDDGYMRVEAINQNVVVEHYSPGFELKGSQTIPYELSIWMGHHFDGQNHYLVFGDSNLDESLDKEVLRVVKYSKDFSKKLGSISDLKGMNTIRPEIGVAFSDSPDGKMLYMRMAHTMFKWMDGLNHQASMSIAIDKDSMSKTSEMRGIANVDYNGYVSHSFKQLQIIDHSGHIVSVDHGDGAPRSVVLYANLASLNSKTPFHELLAWDGVGKTASSGIVKTIQAIPGEDGANATGLSLGGLTDTGSNYLVAYSFNPNSTSSSYKGRKIYLATLSSDASNLYSAQTKIAFTSTMDGSTPYLVANNDGSAWLLWNGIDESGSSANNILYYLKVSKDGSAGSVQSIENAPLSDCEPILVGNSLIWYVTRRAQSSNGSAPAFYVLDPEKKELDVTDLDPSNAPLPDQIYPDISKDHPYARAINWCKENGILTGYADGTFHDKDTISRGMLATILWRMNGQPNTGIPFADVPADSYYKASSAWAREAGYFTGNRHADGSFTFDGQTPISRQDFATVMHRYATSHDPKYGAFENYTLSLYKDGNQVGSWAENALGWSIVNDLLEGVSGWEYIFPRNPMSREYAAQYIYKYFVD